MVNPKMSEFRKRNLDQIIFQIKNWVLIMESGFFEDSRSFQPSRTVGTDEGRDIPPPPGQGGANGRRGGGEQCDPEARTPSLAEQPFIRRPDRKRQTRFRLRNQNHRERRVGKQRSRSGDRLRSPIAKMAKEILLRVLICLVTDPYGQRAAIHDLDPTRIHALALRIQYWPSRSLDLALPRPSALRGP